MIAALKPYQKYKASGLPWLGEIPSHWETRRAKYLFREVDERSQTGKEGAGDDGDFGGQIKIVVHASICPCDWANPTLPPSTRKKDQPIFYDPLPVEAVSI